MIKTTQVLYIANTVESSCKCINHVLIRYRKKYFYILLVYFKALLHASLNDQFLGIVNRFNGLFLKKYSCNVRSHYHNGRTSYVSNYFYYGIRPKGLLQDSERDLLAIAKFIVCH